MSNNLENQSVFTQQEYNRQILRYGKQISLLVLEQLITGLYPYHNTDPMDNFCFFEDIFPLFEKEAQKFYSPQDPGMELLQLFYQSITQSYDFKKIHQMQQSPNDKKRLFKGLFKVVITQANVNTVAYSKLPLFEKILIEQNLPSLNPQNNKSSPVPKI